MIIYANLRIFIDHMQSARVLDLLHRDRNKKGDEK